MTESDLLSIDGGGEVAIPSTYPSTNVKREKIKAQGEKIKDQRSKKEDKKEVLAFSFD